MAKEDAPAVTGGRASQRTSQRVPCIVRLQDRYTEATILNLSSEGAMIDGVGHVQIGQGVDVRFGTLGWIGARVAWAIEPRCGIAFQSPIDMEAVMATPDQS